MVQARKGKGEPTAFKCLGRVFLNLDAEGFQELQVLVADLQFGIAGEGGDQGGLFRGLFAGFAYADGGFQYEKDVVSAFFDSGNDFGDSLGVGQ